MPRIAIKPTYHPSLVKAAAGDQSTFENSLASIGRSLLAGKAPSIGKYEIGFQVLDQDDDNTRAVGVFGYRIGKRLLYVPMFYRDGVVKGIEQLRDPKRNTTVPLTDNYINKYLMEKGDEHGTSVARSGTKDTAQPNLWQLKLPPTKWAADEGDWIPLVRKDLALAIGRGSPGWPAVQVPDLMKEAGENPPLLALVDKMAGLYPWFSDALFKYYGTEKVAAAVQKASVQPPKPKVPLIQAPKPPMPASVLPPLKKKAGVMVIRVRSVDMRSAPISAGMDFGHEELAEFRGGKNAYRDKREDKDTSKVKAWWGGRTGTGTAVSNPTDCGLYQVIGADFQVHPCAVLTPLVGWEYRNGRCLVYRLKDGAWCYTDRNSVWVLGRADDRDFVSWAESLPKSDKLPEKGRYAGVCPLGAMAGEATVPFDIGPNGTVWPSCCGTGRDKPFWAQTDAYTYDPDLTNHSRHETAPFRVRVGPHTGKPALSANCLYLPTNGRLLKLDGDRFDHARGSDPDHFLMHVHKSAADGCRVLGIKSSGDTGFVVSDPRSRRDYRVSSANDLEETLVVSHGLRVKEARELVEAVKGAKAIEASIKYADSLSNDYPSAPGIDDETMSNPVGFADDVLPSQSGSNLSIPIQDMQMQSGDVERYQPYPMEAGTLAPLPGIGNSPDPGGSNASAGPSDDDVKAVSSAAESGRKELMDTASLAALVKHTKLDRLLRGVSKSTGTMVSKLADALAHLYWNTEAWGEKFGDSEVGPLEDRMRDLFEGLGELQLNMQEKAVDSGREFGILPDLDLADSSDSNT